MVSGRNLSLGISGYLALKSRWWKMTRYNILWLFEGRMLVYIILRWLSVISIIWWDKCTLALLNAMFTVVSELSISLTVWWGWERLIVGRDSWRGNGEVNNYWLRCNGEKLLPCTGVGLYIVRCAWIGDTGCIVACISFHRCRNVFRWMST